MLNLRSPVLFSAPGWFRTCILCLLLTLTALGCAPRLHEQNALVSAATNGNATQVTHLLGQGVPPDSSLKDGTTPLFMAAQQGHTVIVKLLLNARANVNAKGYKGATPLIIAATAGHKTIVSMLLKHGARVDAPRNDAATALYMAAQNGYLDIVKQLIKAGADVNKRAYKGATPLFIAAQVGHHTVVETLAKQGADVNLGLSNGTTPLIAAAIKGHISVTGVLLSYGADTQRKNQAGQTAMQVAQQEGHRELLAMLNKAVAQARTKAPPKSAKAQVAKNAVPAPDRGAPSPRTPARQAAPAAVKPAAVATPVAGAAVKTPSPAVPLAVTAGKIAQAANAGSVTQPGSSSRPVMQTKPATNTPGPAQPARAPAGAPAGQARAVRPAGGAMKTAPVAKPSTAAAVSTTTPGAVSEAATQVPSIADIIARQKSSRVMPGEADSAAPAVPAATPADVKPSRIKFDEHWRERKKAAAGPQQTIARVEPVPDRVENKPAAAGAAGRQTAAARPATKPAPASTSQVIPGPEVDDFNPDDSDFDNDPFSYGWSVDHFLHSVDAAVVKSIRKDVSTSPTVAVSPDLSRALSAVAGRAAQPATDGDYLASVDSEANGLSAGAEAPSGMRLASSSQAVKRTDRVSRDGVSAGSAARVTGAKKPPARRPDPQVSDSVIKEQYRSALVLVRNRQYAEGARALTRFVRTYPGTPLVSNAHYWTGVAYYSQGDYQQAASEFLSVYKRFPSSDKAADSLLSLGRSLAAMGSTDAACSTYRTLKNDYPKAWSRIRTSAERASRQAGCS